LCEQRLVAGQAGPDAFVGPGNVVTRNQRHGGGTIDLEITATNDAIVIEVKDSGRAFDLDNVVPLPTELDADALPEGGMGIHIAKTMLDDMTYEPGPPNLWRLYKRLPAAQIAVGRS